MAKQRTPTEKLKATGAFKKDPNRAREDPVTAGPLGSPPSHLTEVEKEAWNEITGYAPVGVLRLSDRIAVEQCARLVAKSRTRKVPNPSEDSRIGWYLSRFGMTPSDRAKFGAPPTPKPQDAADGYLQ